MRMEIQRVQVTPGSPAAADKQHFISLRERNRPQKGSRAQRRHLDYQ